MSDPKRWISGIRAVDPPQLWDEAERRARDMAVGVHHERATGSPRGPRRLAALLTGLSAGAVAVVVVAIALQTDPGREGTTPGVSISPSPSGTPARLDPITLEASLDEEPILWDEVAFVPAGEAEEEIGVQPCSHCERLVPSALAVADDGSFWIADPFKHRIAHFADDGSFIGATRVDEGPADLAFVGDRLYVLSAGGGSTIVPVDSGVPSDPITVNHEGKALRVEALVGGQGELLALIGGAERLLGGYWAYAAVDPATGQVLASPGVLTHFGTRADLQPSETRPSTFELRWSLHDRPTAVQEIRFQLVRGGSGLRTTVGDAYLRTCTGGGVATVMSIGDGAGNPVGVWYLEISGQGFAPIFERLPAEGSVEDARRSLTFGPDGEYWMRLLDDGLHIYRR